MRISYEYKQFPNCPKATEYSKEREKSAAALGAMLSILDFLAVGFYIAALVSFPIDWDWSVLCIGIGVLLLFAFFTFLISIRYPLVTDLNLKIILDEEKIAPLPDNLQKDDYTHLRMGLKKTVREAARPASVYFFCGLGILTGIVYGIIFISKGFLAGIIICLLAVIALVVVWSCYHNARAKQKKAASSELYKQLQKVMEETQKNNPTETWKCPNCGSTNKMTAMFCRDCGTYK